LAPLLVLTLTLTLALALPRACHADSEAPSVDREAEDLGGLPADERWMELTFRPLAVALFGSVKHGPRGQTERLDLRGDLDIGPFYPGLMAGFAMRHGRYSFGLEGLWLGSPSSNSKRRREAVTLFNKRRFPRGSVTRSRLSLQWLRLDVGYAFFTDIARVELLLGAREIWSSVEVSGAGQHTVVRQRVTQLFFPGVAVDLRLAQRWRLRFETRNSFLSEPLGSRVDDIRLYITWVGDAWRLGVGGHLMEFTMVRSKDDVFGDKVNNYRQLKLRGGALSVQVALRF
jgi:hypothetical protein